MFFSPATFFRFNTSIMKSQLATALILAALSCSSAEGATARKPSNPALQPNPRKLNPPPGVPVPTEVKQELTAGVAALDEKVESLRIALAPKPALLELLPDVEIYRHAVR